MKKHRFVLSLVVLCILTNSVRSQWTPEKIRQKREQRGKLNDSAWAYSGFWSMNSFMGEQRLPWKEYINGMAAADDEVAEIIKKYRTCKTIGYVLFIPGAIAATAGIISSLNNLFTSNDSGETAAIAGAVGMAGGLVFIIISGSKYKTAVRLFNLKAKQGTLTKEKISLHFGMQHNGVGMAIRF